MLIYLFTPEAKQTAPLPGNIGCALHDQFSSGHHQSSLMSSPAPAAITGPTHNLASSFNIAFKITLSDTTESLNKDVWGCGSAIMIVCLLLSSKSCLSCVLLDWYCSNNLKLLLWHFGLNEILELAELIICKEFLMESRVKRGKYCQAKQRVQVSYYFVRSWSFVLIFSPQQLLCVWSLGLIL